MDGIEEIIIRRNGLIFKCPVCKKKYPCRFYRCPYCFGNFDVKYYFKNEKEEMKENENFNNRLIIEYERLKVNADHGQLLLDNLYKLIYQKKIVRDFEEEWISIIDFFLETRICSTGYIGELFRKDPAFFERCGKKEGKNYYIKKEAAIDYIKRNGHGRLLNSVKKYLKQRENKCENSENQKNQNSNPLPTGKPLC